MKRLPYVAIVTLSGRLTISAGESEIEPLRGAIGELLAEGHVQVGLELSNVTLMAPSRRVKQLLGVTRLDTIFPVGEPGNRAVIGAA